MAASLLYFILYVYLYSVYWAIGFFSTPGIIEVIMPARCCIHTRTWGFLLTISFLSESFNVVFLFLFFVFKCCRTLKTLTTPTFYILLTMRNNQFFITQFWNLSVCISLLVYFIMNIQCFRSKCSMVEGALVLFRLQNMEVNFVRLQGPASHDKPWSFFTAVGIIMTYLYRINSSG